MVLAKKYIELINIGTAKKQKELLERMKIKPTSNPNKKLKNLGVSEEDTYEPRFKRYNTTFSRLLKLILDMSESEQLLLLERAKSIIDERMLPRRLCLIPVNCTVEEQSYKGLILDINSTGVYIDIDETLSIGQKIILAFFSPFSLNTIQVSGKIIWRGTNGIGVHFNEWSSMRYMKMHRVKMRYAG